MKLEKGQAAVVTGAASGIGRALCFELFRRGLHVTAVDFDESEGLKTVQIAKENRSHEDVNSSLSSTSPGIQFVRCDVSIPSELSAAFEAHVNKYGRIDVCINNAGIGEKEWFLKDASNNGNGHWRKVVDVDLMAVIDGTRLAVRDMQRRKCGGAVVNVASAAGLYPAPNGPIYSASKGGVVLFTRSLAHLLKDGIRVNALCPEFVETGIISQVTGAAAKQFGSVLKSLGGFIPMSTVVMGALELIEDESRAGECMWITNRLGKQWWPTEEEKRRYLVQHDGSRMGKEGGRRREKESSPLLPPRLPTTFSKIVVHKLSSNFRDATRIERIPLDPKLLLSIPGTLLVRVAFAGINASDVNFSAGRYHSSKQEAAEKLPFDAGFEAVGVVAAVPDDLRQKSSSLIRVGQPVAFLSYGTFAEYCVVDARKVILVEEVSPQVVALLTSGLTASIALSEAGKMRSGQTVLVTAAAGGTGQFAVQLAKLAGNKVIATCGSSSEKAALLRSLGADRVVNYTTEDVAKVVREVSQEGADIVYESVGGSMFKSCLSALARFGHLIVIGMISQYTAGEGGSWSSKGYPGLCEKLLWNSQTIVGFFLLHYTKNWREHFARLYHLYSSGMLKVAIDPTEFVGLSSVPDAVEYLQSGKSFGKVVVRIAPQEVPLMSLM